MKILFENESGVLYQICQFKNALYMVMKTLSLEGSKATYLLKEYIKSNNEIRFIIVDWNNIDGICTHIMSPFAIILKCIKNNSGSMFAINMSNNTKKSMEIEMDTIFFEEIGSLEMAINEISKRSRTIAST